MPRHSLYIVLCVLGLAGAAAASTPANRGSIALQAGVWKPSTLDTEPSKPFKPVEGAGWSVGASLCSPQLGGFALRVSLWQWHQKDVFPAAPINQVQQIHLALDLKYQLLSSTAIRPYVTYGASGVYARELGGSAGDDAPLDYLGYALNVGAGVDFQLMRHWGFAADYQYLYIDLERKIGLTSRYSGPKLTFRLLYLF